jgi:hypothetical protein
MTVTNQNLINEEIEVSRLNSRNACNHSVKNLLFAYLHIKMKKKKRILPLVLYGCEA